MASSWLASTQAVRATAKIVMHGEMACGANRTCDDEEYSGDERENLLASIIMREDGDDLAD